MLVIAAGRDAEDIPVQRTVGRERHVAHQVDLFVRETVEAARNDERELRAVVRACGRCEPHHLFTRRGPRRHRIAVAVIVRGRLRRGEAQRTRGQRVVQQALHLRDLIVGRGPADRVVPHHDPSQHRMPAHESGVHADTTAFDAIEIVAERRPIPRHPLLQRGQRDALDACHQARQVVDVRVAAGRERESAVAAEHRRDAVHR